MLSHKQWVVCLNWVLSIVYNVVFSLGSVHLGRWVHCNCPWVWNKPAGSRPSEQSGPGSVQTEPKDRAAALCSGYLAQWREREIKNRRFVYFFHHCISVPLMNILQDGFSCMRSQTKPNQRPNGPSDWFDLNSAKRLIGVKAPFK